MTEPIQLAVDWPSTLMGETLACGLLSKALFVYPEREWLQTLIAEDVFEVAPFAETQPDTIAALATLRAWTAAHAQGLSDAAFNEVRADYTQLFIGVGTIKAAPWESVYFGEERLIFQEETLQVRRWYQRYGLQVQRLNQEPDDHLGLELAFLAHLAQTGLAALEQDDELGFENTLAAQRSFLAEHPLRWVARWHDAVQQYARTDFYRGIGSLTRGVCADLADLFGLRLAS